MIPLPIKANIKEEKKDSIKIEIEGLYPGYGTTIGNSLRRVLISSLHGVAVTQIKIKGVQHEFSTISGVLEDVISIIMNIKQKRFKLYSEESQKAILSIKGEKKVKASDFNFPSQVELVNKDCYIATLTSMFILPSSISLAVIVDPKPTVTLKASVGTAPANAPSFHKLVKKFSIIDSIDTQVFFTLGSKT